MLALLIFLAAGIAAVVLYTLNKYSFVYFGDAASHIVKAREFTDSHGLWFHYLGTVWLPLPHLLLAPFTSIDAFFFSGFAGPIVGIPCLIGTGVLLYQIVLSLTRSAPVAFLCAALFALNPNVVYMSLTPMNEPSLIFFVTLGGFSLLRWLQKESWQWLALSAAAVMLASLCRYEAWILAPFVTLLGAARETARWRGSRIGAALRAVTIAVVSFAGIVFWLWWNTIEFGNPIAFAHGTYGVIPETFRESRQRMPLFILYTLARAILTIFGPVLIYFAAKGLIALRDKGDRRTRWLVLLYFILPAGFVVASVMAGYVGIDEWWWNWRYVLTLGLFLAVAGGIGLARLFRANPSPPLRWTVVAGLLAVPIAQMTIPGVGVATFEDAAKCVSGPTPSAIAVGERLHAMDHGGSIALLTGHGQAQRIMVSSWLDLRRFDIIPDPEEDRATGELLNSEEFLVFGTDRTPESSGPYRYWLENRNELLRKFEISREDDYFILLRRAAATGAAGELRTSSGSR